MLIIGLGYPLRYDLRFDDYLIVIAYIDDQIA